MNDQLYQEVCDNIYFVVSNIIHELPLILPDPQKVTIYEIVKFSLFNEEDADIVFLQDVLQDLLTLGYHSEFFQWVLEGLGHALYVC